MVPETQESSAGRADGDHLSGVRVEDYPDVLNKQLQKGEILVSTEFLKGGRAITMCFKRVQAAKVINRKASYTHKQWEHKRSDGKTLVERLEKYPARRGLMLRHIGKQLEKAAELVVKKHLEEMRAYKLGLYLSKKATK